MNVRLDIQESARYIHEVNVEIPNDVEEDEFDTFLRGINMSGNSGLDKLVAGLTEKYGAGNVEVIKDESPDSEFEVF